MRRLMAMIFALCFTLVNLLSLTAFAAGSGDVPEKPFEKVIAKSGRWYAEQLSYDGKTNLVIGYTGKYETTGNTVMQFDVNEKAVLTGIYIPSSGAESENIQIILTDSRGNIYKGFSFETQRPDGIKEADEAISIEEKNTYIFTPDGDIVLEKGSYTLSSEGISGLTGAFLVKGIHFGAYEKYKQALIDWELKNNPETGKEEIGKKSFGQEVLGKDMQVEYDEAAPKNQPAFALDAEYLIDEIVVSTYNNGNGTEPGIISVLDMNNKVLFSGQSYGVTIEDIANGAWVAAPNILLPAGEYIIALSQPEVLSYDPEGEPLYYVKVSIPVQVRKDFTGTYIVNLDAVKTSTLMGPVNEKNSSFSLKEFELTVLDKEGEIELIGKYEGLPFSQRCVIIEETPDKIIAKFNFAADLTKLPYKARIGADAAVTIESDNNGGVRISLDGTASYDRAESASKGADSNKYALTGDGYMTKRELPPFVMTALGKTSGAGNVPGPDNPAQAAAGILFPPLAGVVVSIIQDLLKPKAPAKGVVRDKNWYKKMYPGKTDEQLAMIMLADAMGSTDNPDEGDAISIGDNERTAVKSSAGESYPENDYEEQWEAYGEETEAFIENEPDGEALQKEVQGIQKEKQPEQAEGIEQEITKESEQMSAEPETLVVQTSANGAETLYVKDPITGEWVDPETNSVLDIEKHGEVLEKLKQEQKWSNKEFEKISAVETEHDKILRENMEKIRQEEQQENYKNMLRSKYGTDDMNEISRIVEERKENAAEWAEIWKRNDKVLGVMEKGAVAVGTAADVGIDGLAMVTPGGTSIRAGYKVLKGVAGTMAEAGAQGKDAFTLANLAEGTVKGGADAALDYIPAGAGKLGSAMTITAKAVTTTAGEAAGAGIGAALRGEDVGEAVSQGLKDGAYKAVAGAVTDKIAGDLPNPVINRGSFKAIPNMKNVIVSSAGGTKIASALADEYVVKPVVMGD